ncbi:hypothetical protein ISN44_As08g039930 [Arabidopsis suecica]|uniref:Plant thionin family protein n=1 Tax=Arabidopsis suecica TaxID=45249 RepID=A0A8T2BEK0_ARASU|nr:uncharacterized protein LOC110230404 [Arabidopsis lyrata subsp. lyrata]KAG7584549.1 hypothetical protein ISN44_As08g039930 [Arabidopsis suecica]|eukprot:XP_020888867.1 uncharacterized protein LOC110230404 [Arabidopsis lyrata subsp. lyrata]
MAKWSAIVVIMMMVIVVVAVEAKATQKDWIRCFRKCSKNCDDHDGNCFERCKIKCGGPNPPHGPSGPPHSFSRISHGTASRD